MLDYIINVSSSFPFELGSSTNLVLEAFMSESFFNVCVPYYYICGAESHSGSVFIYGSSCSISSIYLNLP